MKYYETKIKSKKYLIDGILDVQLEVENDYTFEAGEFCYVKVDGEITRPYSIISFSQGCVTLLVDCRNPGKGSNFFRNIKINESVFISRAVGKFRFNSKEDTKKVFIATGTGIAPFIPMIKNIDPAGVQLIFGYSEEGFENLVDYYFPIENLKVTFCKSTPSSTRDRFSGRVTKYLEIQKPEFYEGKDFYISGRNQMIKEVIKILEKNKVENIFFENYG